MNKFRQVERRRFTRIAFNKDVTILQGGRHLPGTLVDISLNGILIASPEAAKVVADVPCSIAIELADGTQIVMETQLAHSSRELAGFHCISLDLDSAAHLRRLVEMNIPDEGAAERVLGELLKRS